MRKEQCPSCTALMINGIYCHETGCPDSWRNTKRECKWCGRKFTPTERDQLFCTDECGMDYNN